MADEKNTVEEKVDDSTVEIDPSTGKVRIKDLGVTVAKIHELSKTELDGRLTGGTSLLSTEADEITRLPLKLTLHVSDKTIIEDFEDNKEKKNTTIGKVRDHDPKGKGDANGVAELDGAGKVPSAQLPSYVDDVLEYADFASFPVTGESGKIYVALDTNKTYRWGGSAYVEISESLALGETSTTAYRGDRGKAAYDAIHAKYTDAEAVTAMGTKGDANPLNHDKPVTATTSTEGIAKIATQAETDAGTADDKIVTPSKLKNTPDPTRTHRYNFSTRMRVGVGGGAAASGQIQDVPCILFETNKDQIVYMSNEIIPEIDLSSVNPILRLHWLINGAASAGKETARLELKIRYRADGEAWDGVYDETLTQDIEIPLGTAYERGHTDFTLDRTKMASNDGVSVKVTRLGLHGSDDYDSDFGLSQTWLIYSGKGGV